MPIATGRQQLARERDAAVDDAAPLLPLDELGKSGQGRPTSQDALPRDRVDFESDQSFPASDPPSR